MVTSSNSLLVADSYNHKVKFYPYNCLSDQQDIYYFQDENCQYVPMIFVDNDYKWCNFFNIQLKLVDIGSKQCTTLWGVDREVTLNEPGGVCVDSKKDVAYIADTNNHCIRILNIQDTVITQVMGLGASLSFVI